MLVCMSMLKCVVHVLIHTQKLIYFVCGANRQEIALY